MADRRRVVSTTSLLMVFAAVAFSYWCRLQLPEGWSATRGPTFDAARQQTLDAFTASDYYNYLYMAWGGPSLFMFFWVWLRTARGHQLTSQGIGKFTWWVAVVFFAMYLPSPLLPLSIVGMWGLFDTETKRLMMES